jgi:hypothetical protein
VLTGRGVVLDTDGDGDGVVDPRELVEPAAVLGAAS